jgi:hypothetical protein
VSITLISQLYDFNLGDPFSVDVNYASALHAASEDYDSYTSLQFLFFEADRVTPVAISPQPSAWIWSSSASPQPEFAAAGGLPTS